jgi:hypothetical protein
MTGYSPKMWHIRVPVVSNAGMRSTIFQGITSDAAPHWAFGPIDGAAFAPTTPSGALWEGLPAVWFVFEYKMCNNKMQQHSGSGDIIYVVSSTQYCIATSAGGIARPICEMGKLNKKHVSFQKLLKPRFLVNVKTRRIAKQQFQRRIKRLSRCINCSVGRERVQHDIAGVYKGVSLYVHV